MILRHRLIGWLLRITWYGGSDRVQAHGVGARKVVSQ